jgi:carbon monoxide dehydrogenase subunit G
MEIEQSFTVPYPRDVVWASFHDTAGIVACLPGASLSAPPDEGRLKLAMTVKLGPIVASFAGDGEMKLDDTAWRGSVTGGGVDRKSASRVKGEAAFSLDDSTPGETRVDVKVDYSIAGSLAQFSRGGIVKELATRMTDAFAANLKMRLDESVAQAALVERDAQAGAAAVADAQPPAMTMAGPVDGPLDNAAVEPAIRPADQPANQPANQSADAPVPPTAPSAAPLHRANPPATAPLNLGSMFWKILWSRLCGVFGFGARR